jgi:hypothetical protein
MRQMALGNTIIPYMVKEHPRRQPPPIQVDAKPQVPVLVPRQFPEGQVEFLLQKGARWILNHVTARQKTSTVAKENLSAVRDFFPRTSVPTEGYHCGYLTVRGQSAGPNASSVPPSTVSPSEPHGRA